MAIGLPSGRPSRGSRDREVSARFPRHARHGERAGTESRTLEPKLPPVPDIHLVLTTHTTRHLRRSLLGAACQRRKPESITVSCDTDDPAIAELLRDCSGEFEIEIRQVSRAHHGECRLSQVRNNAVRALRGQGLEEAAHVVFMDGDCCGAADAIGAHELRSAGAELVIAFRVDLTQGQTARFDEGAVRAAGPPAQLSPEQLRELDERHRRYERQAWWKVFGLTKAHKPKILGANFSVRAGALLAVNGFDEEFVGWGQEDDDFSRRIYRNGGRPAIAVRDAVVYHQWHPSRAPGSWDESAGIARFGMRLPVRCERGVENAVAQSPVTVAVFRSGREVDSRQL